MLKKFKNFFEPPAVFDLSFEPFVKNIGGLNLQIMKAQDSHLDDLLDLERHVYHGQTPWNRFSFKSELKKHHNSLYLVAYDGSALVAFVGARFTPEDGHITNVAVRPEYQHRGIGTFLVAMMIDYAKQNDCGQMSLEVRIDNKGAQKVYEKLGFTVHKVRENYYVTEHVDGLNMTLQLKKGAKPVED